MSQEFLSQTSIYAHLISVESKSYGQAHGLSLLHSAGLNSVIMFSVRTARDMARCFLQTLPTVLQPPY